MTRQILTLAGALAFSMTLFAEKTTHRLELGDFSELVVVDGVKVNHVCNADSAIFYYAKKLRLSVVPQESESDTALGFHLKINKFRLFRKICGN